MIAGGHRSSLPLALAVGAACVVAQLPFVGEVRAHSEDLAKAANAPLQAATLIEQAYLAQLDIPNGGEGTGEGLFDVLDSFEQDDGPSLRFYGFADVGFRKYLMPSSNPWYSFLNKYDHFYVGNLNLYLDAQISDNFRSLMEIRFLFAPNGSEPAVAGTSTTGGDITAARVNTDIVDPFEITRRIRWGGIEVERAWIDYTPYEFFNIRAGIWLTPVGIWNVDHGSPTLIGVRTPYLVAEGLLPERQTGLQFYGAAVFRDVALDYALTVSNGRNPIDSFGDLDDNKAIGGRLLAKTRQWLGRMELGLSLYYGRFTDRSRDFTVALSGFTPLVSSTNNITSQFDELSGAADFRWEWGSYVAQWEIMFNSRSFTNEGRAATQRGSSFEPDHTRWGTYGLFGYRTPWWDIMPYVMLEYYDFGTPALFVASTIHTSIGINIPLHPTVIWKLAGSLGTFPGTDNRFSAPMAEFQTQLSWAF